MFGWLIVNVCKIVCFKKPKPACYSESRCRSDTQCLTGVLLILKIL